MMNKKYLFVKRKLGNLLIVILLFLFAYWLQTTVLNQPFDCFSELGCERSLGWKFLNSLFLLFVWPSLLASSLLDIYNEIVLWATNIIYYYLFACLIVAVWNFMLGKRQQK